MPVSFVTKVYFLICLLDGYELDSRISELCASLKSQLDEKLDAIDRRVSFTKYKTAPPDSAQRESHRQEYIDKAGIHYDWRSSKELPY